MVDNRGAVYAMHGAARRYCMRGIDVRSALIYTSGWPASNSREVLSASEADEVAFLGSVVLGAFLREIEYTTPEEFSSVPLLRTFLLTVGSTRSYVDADRLGLIEDEVMFTRIWEREQTAFRAYIGGLSVADLGAAELVPYRRVLHAQERQPVWHKLAVRWKVNASSCWYPLRADPMPSDAEAFQFGWFLRDLGVRRLESLLRRHVGTRTYQIRERDRDPAYELDPALWDWTQVETYWTSHGCDWLIYLSHEGSITFAGSWLLEAMKSTWSNWQSRLYTAHGYEPPANYRELWEELVHS